MILPFPTFSSGKLPDELSGGVLRAWSFPVAPFIALLLAGAAYLRGWRLARRTRPGELPPWRAWCFFSGLFSLWIAIASPIDALDDFLLTAHMIQHFMLMSVAPPLIVLGAPQVPLLRGIPHFFTSRMLPPLFAVKWLRACLRAFAHPAVIWLAMNAAYLGWHTPAAFSLTLRSEGWHQFEHLCFFATSVAFWWVVLQPWPSHARWPRWTAIPYLLSADTANTILSALLVFSGRVIYAPYAQAERISSLTPLQDQIAAGSEMWVLNSLVFVVPAVVLAMQLLSAPRRYTRVQYQGSRSTT